MTLDAHTLREGIQDCKDNAAGLDGVLASDLKLLSSKALEWLASMLSSSPPKVGALEGYDLTCLPPHPPHPQKQEHQGK